MNPGTFDDRHIQWNTLAGFDHLHYSILDIDEPNKTSMCCSDLPRASKSCCIAMWRTTIRSWFKASTGFMSATAS